MYGDFAGEECCEFLANCEAEACALVFSGMCCVYLSEFFKDELLIFGTDTGAVVGNGDFDRVYGIFFFVSASFCADGDFTIFGSEFGGIGEEIEDDLLEFSGVSFDNGESGGHFN